MRESTVVAEMEGGGRAEGEPKEEPKAEPKANGRPCSWCWAKNSARPVPPDLASAIEAQTDLDVLSQWLLAAVAAVSLEAFWHAVKQ